MSVSAACTGGHSSSSLSDDDSDGEWLTNKELYDAAGEGDTATVLKLLQNPNVDVNWIKEDECNTSILENAITSGSLPTVQALLEHANGLDPNVQGSSNEPLIAAVITNTNPTMEIWELLVADPRFTHQIEKLMAGDTTSSCEGVESSILDLADYYHHDELSFWLNIRGAKHVNPKYGAGEEICTVELPIAREALSEIPATELCAAIATTLKEMLAASNLTRDGEPVDMAVVEERWDGFEADEELHAAVLGPWCKQLGIRPPTRKECVDLEQQAVIPAPTHLQ